MGVSVAELGRNFARSASYAKYRLRKDVEEYATMVGPTKRVLDIGSGTQTPYRDLFDTDHYVGLDYFESTHVSADATNLPFRSDVASLVVATEVMEHLPEPQKALAEMNRVLETGGYLLMTVPLIWGVHDYIDYQRWTARGLREMLNRHGFDVEVLKPRGGIFSMIGCMIGQIPMQIFGKMAGQSRLRSTLYMACWATLSTVQWILAPLDVLDRKRDFTVGYSLLCCKVAAVPTETLAGHRNCALPSIESVSAVSGAVSSVSAQQVEMVQ